MVQRPVPVQLKATEPEELQVSPGQLRLVRGNPQLRRYSVPAVRRMREPGQASAEARLAEQAALEVEAAEAPSGLPGPVLRRGSS